MKYDPINPELFKINRKRFIEKMAPNTLAIFHSNDEMPRSGDQFYPFRQNRDLFALSGLDQERSILILYPDCPKPELREVAFVRRTNEHIAVWEGEKLTQEKAREISAIENIIWDDQYENTLETMMIYTDGVYLNSNEHERFSSNVESRDNRLGKELMDKYPMHNYMRAQPLLKELAMVKNQYEVELMKRACEITNKGFRRVLEFVKPGVWEHEIDGEIMRVFLANRASGHAYHPIIASGKNACVLHYNENNRECKEGDLILMDFGAEYANYAADLSRTIPVSGRFTERQRNIYSAVLRTLKKATQLLRPGIALDDYEKEVGKLMTSELLGLGLLSKSDVEDQDPKKPAYKKYFMHGTSHHIGLDVHDLSNRYVPMKAGMVFTCEPGIYIPEENIGVRLENDILVTEGDPVNLMEEIPIEIEEIEELMQK
ncbi:MAG: Xaa-Pro aminopeptidase [Saprospiraceae bacterium]|nr:Xaa-Pro aminopeptidase [Saprospiraceae bacterium]